ncbi:MAG TPA: hypothetical protein ENI52_01420 [Thermoplasmata archaeon]|nr:hypothetical protein [Thermoplasmata archaeon]
MRIEDYMRLIEDYCREKEKYGVRRVFTMRWLIKVFNIPQDERIKLLYAIKRMKKEGKIKKRGSKAWEWDGNI